MMTAELDGRDSSNWHQFFGEDLLKELLEKSQPKIFPTTQHCPDHDAMNNRQESMVNKLISTVYSGPTIGDIESALSLTGRSINEHERWSNSRPIISLPEKGLGKIENKYTIKIKACGNNGLTDDGYKWRKYGQKAIKNSPNPRSYYRCTNPRCNAKKQVEKSTEDPDTLIVTYEGLHLHYTYSHFLLSRPHHDSPASIPNQSKKPKTYSDIDPKSQTLEMQSPVATSYDPFKGITSNINNSSGITMSSLDRGQVEAHHQGHEMQNGIVGNHDHEQNCNNVHGLLEDVVPFQVRRPCSSATSSSYDLYSPDVSSPSDSILSWPSHDYTHADMSVLSNLM